jgi:hypothetical protein
MTSQAIYVTRAKVALQLTLFIVLASPGQLVADESPPTLAHALSPTGTTPGGLANGGFEEGAVGEMPEGWSVPAVLGFEAALSDDTPLVGSQVATIRRIAESGAPFGNLLQRVDATPFRGKRVRFRAAARADVSGPRNQAQLWLRVDRVTTDGQRALGAFDNMGDRPITSANWSHYEIVGDVVDDAEQITLGMMFVGQGQAWIDDASIEVVGSEVPITAKSPQGAGRSGKPLEELKPGLFEIVGAMRIAPMRGLTERVVHLFQGEGPAGPPQYVLIPLPLAYRDQAPLSYQLSVDPPSAIEAIEIIADGPVNHVLKAQLADQSEWNHVDINFKAIVAVGPTDFEGVPAKAPIPAVWPDDAKPWLAATWCADAQHERIKAIGVGFRSRTSDVLEVIRLVQGEAGKAFASAQGRVTSLTAVEALDKQGSCTSCANLVAALLRASGVPARVVSGYPSWSGPLQTHYIVEAYVPDYGWYPMESTMGQAPWPNTHQVNVAVIPPEHEEEAKAGARPGIAPGVPYLSLTELPDTRASLASVGMLEGAPGCDHECRMLRPLVGTPEQWREAIELAKTRWLLAIQAELQLGQNGRIAIGEASVDSENDSVARVIQELNQDE